MISFLSISQIKVTKVVELTAFTFFQIVAFLNDLYLALDNILGNYDVFKVSPNFE